MGGENVTITPSSRHIITPQAECSVILNYQLEIVADESVTSIDHYDEFYANLLFDRSFYRPMGTHMGNSESSLPF